jgi:cell division initiation protein
LDIQSAVFHRTFRGYSEAEVDDFLDRVVVEYEQLYRENLALKAQLEGREEAAAAAPPSLDRGFFAPERVEPQTTDETAQLTGQLERLRRAVQEESLRLEGLRRQRMLFTTQFQAMLESYRSMLADAAGAAAAGEPADRGE